jgi:predicted kinase
MSSPLECIILIGLPAAGKTTFYKNRYANTHAHISKDLWPNATGREARQQQLIDETLSASRSVVIDNTNATVAERAKIIDIARGHGARIIGYFFQVTTRAAVARNANRTGKSKVPNVAIFTTAKRLQPPKKEERFDEMFQIEIAEDRSLKVEKIWENC